MRLQATIGQHIRSKVIPAGMTVKDAAVRLGVGRPALSNLLNGRAALSPKMALRLAKAFNVDAEELMQRQAEQDKADIVNEASDVAVRRYVPRPLMVDASDLNRWADTMPARGHLAVLLRKLVHGTGLDLQRVDFPGGANSQRPGWDGWVEAGSATAWIPAGGSGWEFGTAKDPRKKADRDYANRLHLPPDERARCVFVFVTPRNWPGKVEWASDKEASGDGWKAVRAYDASDLEQWLDEAVVAPVWLGEKLPIPIAGIRTLDQCWAEWADATDPKMTKHIFQSSVNACIERFKKWLDTPPKRPFSVAADSQAEALAFLACLFKVLPPEKRDLVAVFDRSDALATLVSSSAPFIPIAANADTQQSLAPLQERVHCIAVCPRSPADVQPGYALNLLDYAAFEEGVKEMGVGPREVERLARESGRSPTILRRRLATLQAVKTPPWANDRDLIPLCLVGAWNAHAKADREVLAVLASCSPSEVDVRVARMQRIEDSPIWAVGGHYGVMSKVDVLFGVAHLMTKQDIDDLFLLAEYVLSESDPALGLPEDDRWAAAVHGKLRDHSMALRSGLCETLVLFSVHGNRLFQERLGIDVEAQVSRLIECLLTPLDEQLPSQERDLPFYAEAAPERLLTLLEADVRKGAPALLPLLKPVSSHPFAPCPRTGLLWALECVAWNPSYLARAALVLADLSRVAIGDNIVQSPINSLASLIRSWMPQTAAPIGQRIRTLELVVKHYPDVGRQLCLSQMAYHGPRFAIENYRPRWRSDAAGAGGAATRGEFRAMTTHATEILTLWGERHDDKTLGDLVQHIDRLTETQETLVWDRIRAWAETQGDEQKAELRGRIRSLVHNRGRGIGNGSRRAKERARATYDQLQPRDPVWRHLWLFANDWPRDVWREGEVDRLDYKAQSARIDGWRQIAVEEIWRAYGVGGVLRLVEEGGCSVGRYVARLATDAAGVLRECLRREDNAHSFDAFMQEFISRHADPAESDVLRELSTCLSDGQTVRLWRCAPFRARTWRALDSLPKDTRLRYWKTVKLVGWAFSGSEYAEIVERLCEVGRPCAAFNAAGPWEGVETGCLKRLLTAMLASGREDATIIAPDRVSAALSSLAARGVVAEEEMANLEFGFIVALERSEHGIPNLERQLSKHPLLFVRVLARLYGRGDGGEDPPEWHVEGEERQRDLAHGAYDVLRVARRTPGTDEDDVLQRDLLWRWLDEARYLCVKHGRSAVGDLHIGELLAKAPAGDDGAPSTVICEAMERLSSVDVARGFVNGMLNERGVVAGRGGDQDRELAATVRGWANSRRADYPFASSTIDRLAQHYEQSARRQDVLATLQERLNA